MPDPKIDQPTNSVLIVDDDRMQGALIRDVCARIGYQPVFAPSYERAAELLATHRFTHVTIDLALGERDGIELLRLLSGLAVMPRVIVISGCDERIVNSAVRLAHAAGACDAISLPKPIELAALRKALTTPPCDCSKLHCPDRLPQVEVSVAQFQAAFEAGEIFAVFQPKVQLSTGKLIGCEALARWNSAADGSVSPDIFIPLAEQSGLIKPLTMLMLREAMALTHEMVRREPAFVSAVNFSATLLEDPTIPEDIEAILSKADVPGRALMIEVTETSAMSDVAKAMDTLLRLRIKGFGISMDDFGTGYSSMSVLAQMPFCELKIDRSFVKNCLTDPDLWKVAASAVAIARSYHMKAVAEGIEDIDTLLALQGIGCDVGQGYVFSPALPRETFLQWCDIWDQRLRDGFLKRAPARKLA
jgi:EAL domain-containing protein (putative c-di-GMP-specific phosphodiesterase class I)/ActR/RegA family two-component response regulator